MSEYQIRLNLEVDRDAAVQPVQARVWIDSDFRADLSSEVEVDFEPEAIGCWSANFCAEQGRFMYRVGVVAPPGTVWALSIRAAGGRDHELLFDSDEVTLPKEWLVGMCEDFELPQPHPGLPASRPLLS